MIQIPREEAVVILKYLEEQNAGKPTWEGNFSVLAVRLAIRRRDEARPIEKAIPPPVLSITHGWQDKDYK
jgi:hypothetical protein